MDFAALPPEVNSGRMYAGAGSGPLLAAASAWDALAAELGSAASSYESVVSSLTGEWSGPSSTSMAAAAEPYVTWMSATAAQAELSANQARAAAAAYEAAFAATVPPPVVAANRTQLATLIATNFLGQNTPAIAATEIHYAEMWAQDAGAMYGYAGSAAAATQLAPFNQPPETTNPTGTANQMAASAEATGNSAASNISQQISQLLNAMPQALQSLASNPVGTAAATSSDFLTNWNLIFSTLTGPTTPLGWSTIPGGYWLAFGQMYSWIMNGMAAQSFFAGPKAITGALLPLAPLAQTALPAASLSSATSVLGNAASVGKLSVPASWAVAAPATKLVSMASSLPATLEAAPMAAVAGQDAMFGEMALSSLLGRGIGGTATQSVGAATRSLRNSGGSDAFGPIPPGEADPAAATIIVIPALDE
ncbi:PPE family protein [[Mycobacterium] holstebronense]|uniref:PPE family protein n=1 Tax=[Mycobacterium] holstebronense TaxID=3064288 RepID=A0ABM9M6E9_9MYCO|nr:PPE family protein [Mycolicibacter sp. MU0102]CAJ1510743.1 PPE family protein [Mycolicibacter sp. MU0102]